MLNEITIIFTNPAFWIAIATGIFLGCLLVILGCLWVIVKYICNLNNIAADLIQLRWDVTRHVTEAELRIMNRLNLLFAPPPSIKRKEKKK